MTPDATAQHRELPVYRHALELPNRCRIAIWGTGRFGRDVLETVRTERPALEVIGFVDSYQEGECLGLPVHRPTDVLNRLQPDLILIASHFRKEIVSTLTDQLWSKTAIADPLFVQDLNYRKGQGPLRRTILVELSQFCVMACDFCTHRIRPTSTNMDFNTFLEIADQISRHRLASHIELSGLGEPLLYPRMEAAIKACTDRKLLPCFLTNAVLLEPDRLQRLEALGLDRLIISLQTLSSESFQHRRPKNGISFDAWYRNVLACLDRHVALGLKTQIVLKILYAKPQWHISRFWNLEGIIHDTERAEALFEGFRRDLDHIARRYDTPLNLAHGTFAETFQTLDESGYNSINFQDVLPGITVQLTNLHPVFHTDMMSLNRKRAHLFITVPPAKMDCTLTQLPYVTATGDVYPCPGNMFDPRDAQELCLGNLKITSLADILNGTRYNEHFRRSITGSLDLAVCRKCKTRYLLKETHV